MQFPKSQLFEICLIEAVKNSPVLYDKDSYGYSNKQDIDRAWDNVLAEVNKKVKEANVTHCKLRWRSLRDRYVKQFVKTTNGAIVEPDLSKWAYNAQLNFLRNHLQKRKFGCEKPPSPKKIRIQPAAIVKRINTSPSHQKSVIIESISPYNENDEHSFSDSSNAYEQDVHVEIDSLEDYECPEAEIEFIQMKHKSNASTDEQLPENPIPEVSNEVVVDPFPVSDVNQNVESILTNTSDEQHDVDVEANTITTASTEECINNLLTTVNNLLKDQQQKAAEKSPNDEYFKVLDGLLKKLPTEELDKAKVDILNFVVNKTKALQRRTLY